MWGKCPPYPVHLASTLNWHKGEGENDPMIQDRQLQEC
jgi:hypothetical protein